MQTNREIQENALRTELGDKIVRYFFYSIYLSLSQNRENSDLIRYLDSIATDENKWNGFRWEAVFNFYDREEYNGNYTIGIAMQEHIYDEDPIITRISYTNEVLEYRRLYDTLKAGKGFFNTFSNIYDSDSLPGDKSIHIRNLEVKISNELQRIKEGRPILMPSKEEIIDFVSDLDYVFNIQGSNDMTKFDRTPFYRIHDIMELRYNGEGSWLGSTEADTFNVKIITDIGLFGLSKTTAWLYNIPYNELRFL